MRIETRARARALQALYAWDVRGAGDEGSAALPRVAEQVWDDLALDRPVRERALTLIRAVTTDERAIDADLSDVTTNWRLERLGAVERSILRLGAAELRLGAGKPYDSFLGVSCVEAIESLRVDLCLVSTSAVSAGYAYHQEPHIVSVKRAMLASAARKVLLIDHTKLGRVALHRVVPLEVFERVIVDVGASPEALRDLDEHKVSFELAAD